MANLGGITPAVAAWPPNIVDVRIIGHVADADNIRFARGIGRSFRFAGTRFYMFGDTYCTAEDGHLFRIVSNSITVVCHQNTPCLTYYPRLGDDCTVDALIEMTEAEENLWDDRGIRVAFWPYGGVLETEPEAGWTWYEKHRLETGNESVYCGVGIAQVVLGDPENTAEDLSSTNDEPHHHGAGIAEISTDSTLRDLLYTIRHDSVLFTRDEPRFGGFPAILEGEFIYLFGYHRIGVFLARVPKNVPWLRATYTFWNGISYVKQLGEAIPVFRDIRDGSVNKSSFFGAAKPWTLVGRSESRDNIVMAGTAETLEGPWELTEICEARGLDDPNSQVYCVYPHHWALEAADGELLVTWSEDWPGEVVAARLTFEMVGVKYWQRVPINDFSRNIREYIRESITSKKDAGLYTVVRMTGVKLRIGGRYVHPGMAIPKGEIPEHLHVEGTEHDRVQEAAGAIRRRLKQMEEIEEEEEAEADVAPLRSGSRLTRAFSRLFRRSDGGRRSSGA